MLALSQAIHSLASTKTAASNAAWIAGLVAVPGYSDLAGCAVPALGSRDFLHKVGIFGAVLQQLDTPLKPAAFIGEMARRSC